MKRRDLRKRKQKREARREDRFAMPRAARPVAEVFRLPSAGEEVAPPKPKKVTA